MVISTMSRAFFTSCVARCGRCRATSRSQRLDVRGSAATGLLPDATIPQRAAGAANEILPLA